MRVLVVGGGGREHALCWAIAKSPLLTALFCAPGNPGTAALATNRDVAAADVAGLVALARAERIDLVLPGPEAPLSLGLADALGAIGIACCGPNAAAAALEGSKAFCKTILDAAGVPTARWEKFDDAEAARAFVRRRGPVVVKADGLAAGKGVVVAETEDDAIAAIDAFMLGGVLGEAGRTVLLEERLYGEEVSVFALCDGLDAVAFGAARDHKRAYDGDQGPNTGGMGAIVPPPGWTSTDTDDVLDNIVRPVLRVMVDRGTPFRGFLFAGLMRTADGLRVIEFNVRLGDPECQALLPLLQTDLLLSLHQAATGGALTPPVFTDAVSVAVVLAASGYPGPPAPGPVVLPIALRGIFHGATRLAPDGTLHACGGRVLTVTAQAQTARGARDAAYSTVGMIAIDGFFRSDIGA